MPTLFVKRIGISHEIKLLPKWIDGVEVYNSGNGKEVYNQRAKWYAEQFGFKQTGGTDNHHLWVEDSRISGVATDEPINSIEDYIEFLRDGKLTPICLLYTSPSPRD